MFERFLSSTPKPRNIRNRYTRFQQKLTRQESVADAKSPQEFPLNLLLLTISLLLLSVIFCQLSYDTFFRGVKSVAFGVIAVFFSWEVVYFDSTSPGVTPPSPLKLQRTREAAMYAIHTSYLFSVVNGVLFTIMIYLWT